MKRGPRRVRAISAPPETKHSLIASLTGAFDPQVNCPLFSTVPPELRNRIFLFALISYNNLDAPFPADAYYYRPGYHHRQHISTALLATCRRVYAETHTLPVSQNEHVFWCNRGPPIPGCGNPKRHFRQLTVEQQAAVVNVHFFTQLYWLEGSFPKVCEYTEMRPKHIKITVRHTDWWYWEANTPLQMKTGWGDNLKAIKGLQGLEVELETMDRDKKQVRYEPVPSVPEQRAEVRAPGTVRKYSKIHVQVAF